MKSSLFTQLRIKTCHIIVPYYCILLYIIVQCLCLYLGSKKGITGCNGCVLFAVEIAVFESCCSISLDISCEFCGVSQLGGTLGGRGGAGPETDISRPESECDRVLDASWHYTSNYESSRVYTLVISCNPDSTSTLGIFRLGFLVWSHSVMALTVNSTQHHVLWKTYIIQVLPLVYCIDLYCITVYICLYCITLSCSSPSRRIRWHVLYDSILSTSVYRCIQHLRHFQTQYLLLLHSILEFLITTPRFVALFDLTRCDYAKSKMCVRVSDQRPKVMLNKLKSNHILPWISKWDPLPYHTEIRWHDDWLMLCCIAPYLAAWDLILPM